MGTDRSRPTPGRQAYIDAFFRRRLTGDKRFDSMSAGKRHPLARTTSVDVTAGRR
ncbi:hypothetical protein ABZX74_26975 [Streptomyces olivaceoviridis]|uniref:hypothetical protein n=1 Tax=Streptomyces olivaceoviridis TaxID=1921 RepID=UPI0033A53D57